MKPTGSFDRRYFTHGLDGSGIFAPRLYRELGQGHVVSFAIRPFWRWQTQGDFFLAFNAILNWNDLDAGCSAPKPVGTGAQ